MTVNIVRKLILAILLASTICSVSYGQVNWKKYSYFQNFAGLNDNKSTTEIEDNEATNISNVIFDTGGALRKRFGFLSVPTPSVFKISSGTTVCVNGITFLKRNNGNKYLFAIANDGGTAVAVAKAYSGGPVIGRWDNVTNGNFTHSYTNNIKPSFTIASDSVIFVLGDNTQPYYCTGAASSAIISADAQLPSGNIVVYHKNHLFVANSSTWPSRTWFSELDDVTNWIATDFFDVQISDGSQVRGLISAYDALYIFKDKSIWRLGGTNRDDFVLQKMVDGIGTLSHESIKLVNNVIYFITPQNDVAIYDGGYNVQFISQKIRGTIGGLSFNRAANAIGLAFSSYKYIDYDYYASVSNSPSSTNNLVLLFDTAYKAWTKFSGINANCWTVGDDSNSQNAMFFGDYDGYVHQYPSTTYYDGNVATSAIAATYQTKWFRYPEVGLADKYWRLLKTYALSESSGVVLIAECRADYEASGREVLVDLSSSAAQWDVAQWDVDLWGGQTIIVGRNEIEKGKNMFQLKYSQNDVNQGFTIVGFENFIEDGGRAP